MSYKYHMPTKVISGQDCILSNSELFKRFGKKAMLVTGRASAKKNGSQDDVIQALQEQGIEYVVFDQVMANPTIACTYQGAEFAKQHDVDFVIAIGGGSPMDAAKVMALLARQDIKEENLFSGPHGDDVLPIIAVPTTAGTGSEVTPYAILTNDVIESKTSLGPESLFPQIAFLDARYMLEMSVETTVNTAIDAFSHAAEGMMTVRASLVSNALAKESIAIFTRCIPALREAVAKDDISVLDLHVRNDLLQCSMLAGIVIAQTGTAAVHAMGYTLTYFKDIDHGRANGLLIAEYMKLVEEEKPQLIEDILAALNIADLTELDALMCELLGEKEVISEDEMVKYIANAARINASKNNSQVTPSDDDVGAMFRKIFGL